MIADFRLQNADLKSLWRIAKAKNFKPVFNSAYALNSGQTKLEGWDIPDSQSLPCGIPRRRLRIAKFHTAGLQSEIRNPKSAIHNIFGTDLAATFTQ